MAVDKVIAKIIRLTFLAHPVHPYTTAADSRQSSKNGFFARKVVYR